MQCHSAETIETTVNNLSHILAKCQSKDRTAQQQLYNFTYSKLCAAVAVYSKDNSERDWIFNLGMLKVFTSLNRYELNTNYLGWARTILVRSAIDHLRSNKKHSNNLSPIQIETQQVSSKDFEDMMNTLETEVIVKLLERLPEKERLIFSMYELDGYNHKEIEKITGIKNNTSKWLLSKSKKSLKDLVNNSQDFKMIGHGE